MTSSSAASTPIVVDANLALTAVLPLPTSSRALDALDAWADEDRPLLAPGLWAAEVVSGIRRLVFGGEIGSETAERGIDDLFELGVETVPLDADLCRGAHRWAKRLTQSKAYDGFYLALAERRRAELWTADRRLVRRSHQLHADWVHHLEL
jgi:predicted nucleic acid-binding protein